MRRLLTKQKTRKEEVISCNLYKTSMNKVIRLGLFGEVRKDALAGQMAARASPNSWRMIQVSHGVAEPADWNGFEEVCPREKWSAL